MNTVIGKGALSDLSSELHKELSLKQGIVWNSVGSLIYLTCNWVTTVLAVVLSPDFTNSGILAVAMAVGNIFSAITFYKVRPVQVSDIDNEFRPGDFIGFRIACLIGAAFFCGIYSFLTASPEAYIVVAVYLVFRASESVADVFHGIDQQFGRLDYVGISQIIRGLLVLVLFPLGLVLTGSLLVSVSLMAVATGLAVLLYDIPKAKQFTSTTPLWDMERVKKILYTCTPGFLAALFCTAVVSVVRQFYGLEYGTEALGIYATIATPCVIVQAFASYLYAPLLKPLAQLWKQGDATKLRQLILKFTIALLLITVGVYLLFLLCGTWAFGIVYGEEITHYTYLFGPILACTAAAGYILFFLELLIVFRKLTAAVICNLVSFIVAVITMNWFFGAFDMNGISFAILFSYFVGIVLSLGFVSVGLRKKEASTKISEKIT